MFGDNAVVKPIKGKVKVKMESDDIRNIPPRIQLETIDANENREAAEETDEYRALLEELMKSKSQISNLFFENQKNEETIASLQTENKSSCDQLDILRADNEELVKKVGEAQTKMKIEMQKNMEATAVLHTEKEAFLDQLNNSKAEIEVLSKEIVQTQTQLKSVTSERNQLAAVIQQLRKGIDSTKTNVQKETDESDDSDAISDENAFDVKQLIKHRKKNRKTQFLVRWGDSWVDEKDLNCPKLLKKYYDAINLK